MDVKFECGLIISVLRNRSTRYKSLELEEIEMFLKNATGYPIPIFAPIKFSLPPFSFSSPSLTFTSPPA